MRIHLRIKSKQETIPYNHQHMLVGSIQKWIGQNGEHGKISLYSFSRLKGGTTALTGLVFRGDCAFFFSAYNDELIRKLIAGIRKDPSMFCGLQVYEVIFQDDPDFTDREIFQVASPVFIKRNEGLKTDHILYTDSRASDCLVETMKKKMCLAGLSDDSLEISFLKDNPRASTKKVTYNGIENRASWCPVIIKGNRETKSFAWNVGLGNSTGIGFGAIM